MSVTYFPQKTVYNKLNSQITIELRNSSNTVLFQVSLVSFSYYFGKTRKTLFELLGSENEDYYETKTLSTQNKM